MADKTFPSLSDFPHTLGVAVRWNDYDMVNHVNNVQFYVYFEEAVVSLCDVFGLDWLTDRAIPFVAESKCRFLAPIPFPSKVTAGIGVERLGTTSLTYGMALYVEGRRKPVAVGHFIHVFVDRDSETPTPIPAPIRATAGRYLLANAKQ
ncbi:thioesterase family protein [Magnetovibrio sp.]|uniref:acyl-CoA thioesterase n=1 Tax=Magnetovibrio sp. TaxID=2024836 RepID=UPI002F93C5B8